MSCDDKAKRVGRALEGAGVPPTGGRRETLIAVYQRRRAEAEAQMAEWQAKIDNAPPGTSAHQLGVWRGRVRDCRRRIEASQRRMQRLGVVPAFDDNASRDE